MERINSTSIVTVDFSLGWQSQGVNHKDKLWTNRLDLWRDFLSPELISALEGKKVGEKAEILVPASEFAYAFNSKKIVKIKPSCFYSPIDRSKIIKPVIGRFYPQGFLHGVPGVFQESIEPARFLGEDNSMMVFDLNHPLAGYDLKLSVEVQGITQKSGERGGKCEDWLVSVSENGPGMQARYKNLETDFFPLSGMERQDESSDHLFYESPRMVQHLDSKALDTIETQYGELIKPRAKILDLMGSWDSHLSDEIEYDSLTILGMNPKELNANEKAAERVVHDLNQNHVLPFPDSSFDAVTCTASVEYLKEPLKIFSQVHRTLKQGGVFAVSFSNRWFPPKAVKIWSELHEFERLAMALELFHRTPGFKNLETLSSRGFPRPEDDRHQDLLLSDPVYMAWGIKG